MRRTVLVGLAVLAIAGCGSAASTTPASPPLPSSPSASSPHPASSPALAAFGTARQVTDDQGRPLTVTPVTAWWLPGDIQSRYDPNAARYGLAPAEHGRFLIIEMRVEAASSAGGDFPAPVSGVGPIIISSHQVFTTAESEPAVNAVWDTCLPGINTTVSLQPGNWLMDGETFDVPPGPAVLTWQGTPGAPSWQVPARSTSPLPGNITSALRTGNGC
jgi:hypothetical protein